jgi:hypothetical protein
MTERGESSNAEKIRKRLEKEQKQDVMKRYPVDAYADAGVWDIKSTEEVKKIIKSQAGSVASKRSKRLVVNPDSGNDSEQEDDATTETQEQSENQSEKSFSEMIPERVKRSSSRKSSTSSIYSSPRKGQSDKADSDDETNEEGEFNIDLSQIEAVDYMKDVKLKDFLAIDDLEEIAICLRAEVYIAKIYLKYFGEDLLINNKELFCYDPKTKLWREMSPRTFAGWLLFTKGKVSTKLRGIQLKANIDWKIFSSQFADEYPKQYKKLQKEFKVLFNKISPAIGRIEGDYITNKDVAGLASLTVGLLEQRDIDSSVSFNSQKFLLPTKEGCIEFITDAKMRITGWQIVPREKEHYFTFYTKLNPNFEEGYKDQKKILKECNKIINEIVCFNEEKKQVICSLIALTLAGDVSREIFVFMKGPKRSGKGLLFLIIKQLLGRFAASIDADIFLKSNGGNKGSGANSAKMQTKDKRALLVTELGADDVFSQKELNNYVGRGENSTRELRKTQEELETKGILWNSGNYPCRFERNDPIIGKCYYLPSKARFLSPGEKLDEAGNDTLPKEYKERIQNGIFWKDRTLKDRIVSSPELLTGFFQVIMENAKWDLDNKPEWTQPHFIIGEVDPQERFIDWVERNYILNWSIAGDRGIKASSIRSKYIELHSDEDGKSQVSIKETDVNDALHEKYSELVGPTLRSKSYKYNFRGNDYRLRLQPKSLKFTL